MALAGRALSVPQIARRMGLTRQSVHATVRILVEDGLVALRDNVDHVRSPLVTLTDHGTATFQALAKRQAVWVNELAHGLDQTDLDTAALVLEALCRRLDPHPT